MGRCNHQATTKAVQILPPVKTSQRQARGICGDGVLYLVLFALFTGLESVREQGAQNLDDHPQHTRAEQHKDEHEHQHDSGGDEKLNHGDTSLF